MFYYMYIVHVSLWSTFSLNLLNSFENIHPFDTGRCVLVTPWCCWWRNWSDQYNVSAAREKHSCEKEELWRRRIDLVKKTTPFIYWWSGFPRVFLPFAVLCRKSYCIDQDVHYQAILSRKSCTNLSFSPDAVLMSIRSCFLVVFEGLLLEKEKSARFALPLHLQILQWGHELLQCRSGHLLSQKVYLCPSWQSDQPWHVMRTILPASIFDQLIPYNSCTEKMWIL